MIINHNCCIKLVRLVIFITIPYIREQQKLVKSAMRGFWTFFFPKNWWWL